MKKLSSFFIILLSVLYLFSCDSYDDQIKNGVVYYPEKTVFDVVNNELFTVVTNKNTPFDGTVYITPNGKKYHYVKSCPGENAISTSLESALASGKEACQKCVE